jgi:hypothetical protein
MGFIDGLLLHPHPHLTVHRPHNGLAARLNGDVLHRHFLLAASAIRPQALRHCRKHPKRLRCAANVAIHSSNSLLGEHRTPQKIHALTVQGYQLRAQHHFHAIARRKTPRMTQRYAHLSPDYMAGAVGKLDGIMGTMLLAAANS